MDVRTTVQNSSPFEVYLRNLYNSLIGFESGEIASYIPELAKASPSSFGLSFATIDGKVYSVGDSRTEFSIQSVSKPFSYGAALRTKGSELVLKKVGVEPTGEAFNSIVLDQKNNRPFNPMVNAGAIAISALIPGGTHEARIDNMVKLFSSFAGRQLAIDEAVYRSEAETGHRNRAIAHLMLNTGMIDGDPEEVLDLYFRQCALKVTTEDLAVMGATLANDGINPLTRERVIDSVEVRDVLTLMMSCGMYDYAGEWSYDVGLPAKSGVSGGLIAVLPGQLSLAIWSPLLDPIGNSVRGVEACRRLSQDFGLHLFMNAATVENVVRRSATASLQQSLRTRNPRERDILAAEGHRIAVVELQGALYFASSERMIRHLDEILDETEYLILDMHRLNSVDAAAERVMSDYLADKRAAGIEISIAEAADGLPGTTEVLTRLASANDIRVFASVDAALESSEEMLLERFREPFDHSKFSLATLDLFKGLSNEQLREVEAVVRPMQFEKGERIFERGDDGQMFFVIARGSVSVLVQGTGDVDLRVGCIGPGQFFGEMAVLGDGLRSADVVADERVVCYGLTSFDLDILSAEDPAISSTILSSMAREFAERIRRSNNLISSLK